MNPAITAWLEYKRLADIQPSCFQRGYGRWISACVEAHERFREIVENSY